MMKNKLTLLSKLPDIKAQRGSVLLEALIAVVIFSFGILAISGLQAAMIKNTTDATYRAEAAYVVQQYLGEMMTKPYGFGQGMALDVDSLPNGKMYVNSLSDGRLRFRVTWKAKGTDAGEGEAIGGEKHGYEAVTTVFTAR
jgi:type IV pilus assembly protein PilV